MFILILPDSKATPDYGTVCFLASLCGRCLSSVREKWSKRGARGSLVPCELARSSLHARPQSPAQKLPPGWSGHEAKPIGQAGHTLASVKFVAPANLEGKKWDTSTSKDPLISFTEFYDCPLLRKWGTSAFLGEMLHTRMSAWAEVLMHQLLHIPICWPVCVCTSASFSDGRRQMCLLYAPALRHPSPPLPRQFP